MSLFSQILYAQFYDIARYQKDLWIPAHPHSRRGTGTDDVTRLQRHELTDVVNQKPRVYISIILLLKCHENRKKLPRIILIPALILSQKP